jgi:pimeloyl-ACP methyl ester carboxylesterase
MLRFDATSRLSAIKAQTAILHGEEDRLVPPENAAALQAAIAGSTLTMLPGGHAGIFEYPDAYNAAILEALGVTAPAAAR